MGVLNILCLVVILQAVWVRGEDEVIDEEELAKEEKEGKEMEMDRNAPDGDGYREELTRGGDC